MPSVFNPECLMMARSSKSILSRVKANLGKLCETDQIQPNGQSIELITWKSKYCAEIMDLCSIEIVQLDGMTSEDSSAPPTSSNTAHGASIKLNMYLILFSRPQEHKSTPETIELFNSI